MRLNLLLLPALVALSACQQAEAPAAKPEATAVASASASPTTAPVARSLEEETKLYSLSYSYPVEAAAIPALAAVLEAELKQHRGEVIKDAGEGQKDAKEAGYEFRPFARGVDWSLVTETPGWVSLLAEVYTYSGGAHPNHDFAAMLWDKAAGQRRAASDLFVSPKALSKAIRNDFCREIDKQRAEKRGEPVKRGESGVFDDCIDPLESTLILGSSNRRTFDRIGIMVAPYDAGPYAEGDYEVTLPVGPAVLAVVRPEFKAAFSLKR